MHPENHLDLVQDTFFRAFLSLRETNALFVYLVICVFVHLDNVLELWTNMKGCSDNCLEEFYVM